MDREKLNKASVDYSRSLYACGMYDKETPATPNIAFAFTAGSNYVMGQPLSERLTEAEKEKLTPANRYVLETIFGKELFNDNPGLIR